MSKQIIKKITSFQLISLISILVLFGVFLLISSGLFDTAEIKSHQHTNSNTNNKKSSVNLNKINEINILENLFNNNPKDHKNLIKLAHMLNDNGFYKRAIEKYKIYLIDHSTDANVIVDMGVCLFELKEYEKSINTIKSALEIEPKHQIANFNLGIVNLAYGNKPKAVEWWKKAQDIDPNSNIGKKAEELLKTTN